uniref:Uncharacterized protein n=1 Tax=Plectus sambesii TaxID=2011161 RepID=A0A914V8G4_9BILA
MRNLMQSLYRNELGDSSLDPLSGGWAGRDPATGLCSLHGIPDTCAETGAGHLTFSEFNPLSFPGVRVIGSLMRFSALLVILPLSPCPPRSRQHKWNVLRRNISVLIHSVFD